MQRPPEREARDGPRARARAAALGAAGARGHPAAGWLPELSLAGLWQALAAALVREFEDRRGFLFLPLGFAAGAALYFAAPHEPLPYAGWVPALGSLGLAVLARARPFAFHFFAMLAVVAAGFAVAALQVQRMAHPVLATTLNAVEVSGYVEAAELRPRGSRITLAVTRLERPRTDPPRRVRVTLAGREPPAVGSHVTLRATLAPPPGPSYPGGFDFGRAIWLDGIGATGYALGRLQLTPARGPPPPGLALTTWLDGTRRAIAARIQAALPGEEGGVAVALVTGLRDAVPESIEESMRISGLSHVLSISGLHMALVASSVFFLARALLALVPEFALYRPIKAWAALPAMASASFYLLLSGAEVPTQRAYVMTLLVLAGIVLGRPALTLRTLALAALALLALSPRAVLDPGAQMSFAATLGLVAAYERFGYLLTAVPARTGRWLGVPARHIAALVLASLAAGLATAPYAAYHFQRLAPLSLLANLGAAPVVSFIVMPAGLAGAVLIPFGWDDPAWRLMGWGLARMRDISDLVAALPGADRGVPAMPVASLVLISLGLVVLCLARTRLVLLAPVLATAGLAVAATAPRPDLYVDTEARTVAVRGRDGALAVMGDRDSGVGGRFAVEQWLSADGARSRFGAKDLTAAAACDPLGCTLALPDGRLVALSRDRDSLEDDCRLAAVLVTPFAPPLDCAATVIYRDPRISVGGVSATLQPDGRLTLAFARRGPGTRPWEPKTQSPPTPASEPASAAGASRQGAPSSSPADPSAIGADPAAAGPLATDDEAPPAADAAQ
ncbi:ComEC/Rec2 family competence protein [Ancylobacter polymorphus]|uniref:ComEC family competence protein n=1 Tax=Ancylobacter polymorphus TaxID=223390 RepID=A0A9E7A5Q0_9HYPH|nr:ComEC/Rec2 family competence protein [Ancylobacter polymorphus]UOK70038.1 ComEC family competence protein [Ancylobacter polymorphus]